MNKLIQSVKGLPTWAKIALVGIAIFYANGALSGSDDKPTAPTAQVNPDGTPKAYPRDDAPTAETRPAETRPGSPLVYERIADMTNCAALQEQFDLAAATSDRSGGPAGTTWLKIGIAYMDAADDRMREVGCYN